MSLNKTPFTLFIIVFFLLKGINTLCAQEIEWQNTIGGSSSDFMKSIGQTTDGGYICGGFTFSNISGDKTENNIGFSDYWVLKLDAAGTIQWQNSIGGSNYDELSAVFQTVGGGYFCAGNSRSDASGDKSEDNIGLDNFWVVKLQPNGTIHWENTIGGSSMDLLRTAIQTSDSGFVIAGSSTSNISGDKSENSYGSSDFWVVKLNVAGIIQWQRTIGGSSGEMIYSIFETHDGGIVCGGVSSSNISGIKTENSNGMQDFWVVKLDSVGNIEWQNTIGGSESDFLISISQTYDRGYICGGYSNSGISGDKTEPCYGGNDYWVIKLDSLGNILWQNTIGGDQDDELLSIGITSDNEFICGGKSHSGISFDKLEMSQGFQDYWIVKLDSVGHILWQNTIGGNGTDELTCLKTTSTGDIICGGNSVSGISGDKTEINIGPQDYWVVKITTKYNLITGQLYEDANSNYNFDFGEILIPFKKVNEIGSAQFAYTDQNGFYSILMLDTGSFTVEPASNSSYYNLSPLNHNAIFNNFLEIDSINDFAFQPTGAINDLCVTITPVSPFRSGTIATYKINYTNEGTTYQTPTIVFYPDSNISFVSSIPSSSVIYPDSIIWNLGAVSPFSSGFIMVTVLLNQGLQIGQVINSGALILPILGDPTPQCNLSYRETLNTGSHDPNDITVNRQTLFDYEISTPDYLEYLIRFQNVGNDTAFYVKVENQIQDELDISTFRLIDTSHPYRVEYHQYESKLYFIFENIELPDSNTNELNSHGFIRYEIMPKTTLFIGDSILNEANIIFDYNPAVNTNLAVTEIIQPTSIGDELINDFVVYPNPTSQELSIEISKNSGQEITIDLLDVYGQKVKQLFSGKTLEDKWIYKYDLSDVGSGLYFITITGYNSVSKKLIKF